MSECNICHRDWCAEFVEVPTLAEVEMRPDFLGKGAPMSAELCDDEPSSWATFRTADDLAIYAVRYHEEQQPGRGQNQTRRQPDEQTHAR